jgi:hypothetical protein
MLRLYSSSIPAGGGGRGEVCRVCRSIGKFLTLPFKFWPLPPLATLREEFCSWLRLFIKYNSQALTLVGFSSITVRVEMLKMVTFNKEFKKRL